MTLQESSARLFDDAKWWWTVTNVLRVGTVLSGVSATLLNFSPLIASLFAALFAFSSWGTQLKTDRARDQANDLRRQLDLQDGLGWQVSPLFLADLSATTGLEISRESPAEPYFEGNLPSGPRRLTENIRETGFFSEHLARWAAAAMWWITGTLVVVILVGLFTTLAVVHDLETARTVGVVLASVLLGVEATGVARLALDYQGLQKAACEAKAGAERMLSHEGEIDLGEVVHLAETYYINRARAPLLPGWLYTCRRGKLNRLWRRSLE